MAMWFPLGGVVRAADATDEPHYKFTAARKFGNQVRCRNHTQSRPTSDFFGVSRFRMLQRRAQSVTMKAARGDSDERTFVQPVARTCLRIADRARDALHTCCGR